jgi:hypothetical protein
MPRVWLLPACTYDSDVHSGRRRGRGETPVTVSPHCPTPARYELHGFTVKLIEKKRDEERAPKYSDHGELDLMVATDLAMCSHL